MTGAHSASGLDPKFEGRARLVKSVVAGVAVAGHLNDAASVDETVDGSAVVHVERERASSVLV